MGCGGVRGGGHRLGGGAVGDLRFGMNALWLTMLKRHPQRRCAHCNRAFLPTRAWQRFDTPTCRMAYFLAKQKQPATAKAS